MTNNKNCTKYYSSRQEQQLAKLLDGKVVSGSGGGRFDKGDILTEHFLVEAKTPMKPQSSFSIKESWLQKMKEQAFEQDRHRAVLAIQFEPNGENYFVLSTREFLEYKELLTLAGE